jgi:hypothetical protein
MNQQEPGKFYRRPLSNQIVIAFAAGLLAWGLEPSVLEATEPPTVTDPPVGRGGIIEGRQNQEQFQDQSQEQFQDQSQTQRQGDNRVSVDGDDVDYFALALPNLVAASCAGSSYSVGGGGGGIGFGFGSATIDENCQIAKAIATAHLLEGAKLIDLSSKEYRAALCQMRGMEHVCKADYKKPSYPGWCKQRVRSHGKASKWSNRDLRSCGLRRAYFKEDRERWLKLTHYDGREVKQHAGSHKKKRIYKETVRTETCPGAGEKESCPVERIERKNELEIRTGQHCDFDRVVFDWPERVEYNKVEAEHKVTIKFHRASEIDVSHVKRDLGRFIIDASWDKRETESYATLHLASQVEANVWRLGSRVIVDGSGLGCY